VGRWPSVACLSVLWLALPAPTLGGHAPHPEPVEATCQATAYYSPHGGATAATRAVLDSAERTILVAAYGLTSSELVASLSAARARGVEVSVKADKVQSASRAQQAALADLEQAGITVEVSAQSRLLHDKFAVVDGRWIVTGSFNWTATAENRNRENLVVLDCPDLARAFTTEWELIRPDAP